MRDFIQEMLTLQADGLAHRTSISKVLQDAAQSLADSDPCYLHLINGYAAYHFPQQLSGLVSVEPELLAVLSTDKNNTTAKFYLGCFYFDEGDYCKSLDVLESIDVHSYEMNGQFWRSVKIKELVACCRILMSDYSSIVDDLARIVERVETLPADNVAAPTEIVSSFENRKACLREAIGLAAFRKCVMLIRQYARFSETEDCFAERLSLLEQNL